MFDSTSFVFSNSNLESNYNFTTKGLSSASTDAQVSLDFQESSSNYHHQSYNNPIFKPNYKTGN